jgi:hypothetical protein
VGSTGGSAGRTLGVMQAKTHIINSRDGLAWYDISSFGFHRIEPPYSILHHDSPETLRYFNELSEGQQANLLPYSNHASLTLPLISLLKKTSVLVKR